MERELLVEVEVLSVEVARRGETFGSFREPEFMAISRSSTWEISRFNADQALYILLLFVHDPAGDFGVGFGHVECDLRGQLVHERGCWGSAGQGWRRVGGGIA